MTTTNPADYGTLKEDATLVMRRTLPGPIERVWDYLTQSDLRAQWLAAGDMEMKVGSPFELVWKNSELTDPPGEKPEGSSGEHRMQSRIIELDPPHKLSFSWDGSGDVTFELALQGADVLLTVTHQRLPTTSMMRGVSTGWHAHLDLLLTRVKGEEPEPFWDSFKRLRKEYERRIPA